MPKLPLPSSCPRGTPSRQPGHNRRSARARSGGSQSRRWAQPAWRGSAAAPWRPARVGAALCVLLQRSEEFLKFQNSRFRGFRAQERLWGGSCSCKTSQPDSVTLAPGDWRHAGLARRDSLRRDRGRHGAHRGGRRSRARAIRPQSAASRRPAVLRRGASLPRAPFCSRLWAGHAPPRC